MSKLILKLISFYQKIISPDHGLFAMHPHVGCRFYPSCSNFSKEVIEKKGPIKGLPKILWRIIRCNPLSSGGIDQP